MMKLLTGARALILFFALLCTTDMNSQYYILGRALDDDEHPYSYAKAELRGKDIFKEQICTELGVFRFENLKSGKYELVVITPYGIRRKEIELRGSVDVTLHISRNIEIDEISVVAKRASKNEPVTHQNISAEELRKRDTGQDMPYLLEGSTSLVATSDAGSGIGYTGLRIRGIDPTRINVTLNGIPVNDAESHNVFWVDLPDIAGSTTNIQIQRGLGWSQPGAGDLGAGIHLNTLAFNYEPYGGFNLGAGSFGATRASLNAGSGLILGRFTIDGRATYIKSDGFIDRAKSDLYSLYGSAGYHHELTHILFVYALGDELTYQAWNGVPEQYVFNPSLRTYNSAGTERSLSNPHNNEVDDYRQSYYQLHIDQALTPYAKWTNAIHYTKGKGFFEQYKADQNPVDYSLTSTLDEFDLIRRLWLDNDFYGFTSTLQIGKPTERYLVLGGGWNQYRGEHFGNVIWTEEYQFFFTPHNYYFNQALKTDWNLFGRSNLKLTQALNSTIDLQGRWITYQF
ncbi:MAG TPA: TonB-dependent receptor plug domain-containing protein, partial [Saprospiraceae bacterium]|nr:TonB-dependent receptor plug domain-containing protein [Saprospiraceae bacterium]